MGFTLILPKFHSLYTVNHLFYTHLQRMNLWNYQNSTTKQHEVSYIVTKKKTRKKQKNHPSQKKMFLSPLRSLGGVLGECQEATTKEDPAEPPDLEPADVETKL